MRMNEINSSESLLKLSCFQLQMPGQGKRGEITLFHFSTKFSRLGIAGE